MIKNPITISIITYLFKNQTQVKYSGRKSTKKDLIEKVIFDQHKKYIYNDVM